MNTYTYYPGCSMSATGKAYAESLETVAKVLDIRLAELDDWNCCGATAYFSVRETLSHAISARNLALAEAQGPGRDVVAACSACYLGLNKTNKYLKEFPELRKRVDSALDAGGLKYDGSLEVRHILEVVVKDVGLEKVAALTTRKLEGLKVASYAGCQMVRPYGFDDSECPVLLDNLVRAVGATPVPFAMAARCCGGSQMMTNEDAALRMTKNILLCAQDAGADVIITTCPLCQMNLDAFQAKVNHAFGTSFNIPILFFTQLLGLAFQVKPLGIERGVAKPGPALARFIS